MHKVSRYTRNQPPLHVGTKLSQLFVIEEKTLKIFEKKLTMRTCCVNEDRFLIITKVSFDSWCHSLTPGCECSPPLFTLWSELSYF
jgi:hypothetical protein